MAEKNYPYVATFYNTKTKEKTEQRFPSIKAAYKLVEIMNTKYAHNGFVMVWALELEDADGSRYDLLD